MKTIAIRDVFSVEQLKLAMSIGRDDHKRLVAEVIEPNMAAIEQRCGQAMDAGYLAYMLEYAMGIGVK